MFGLHAGKGFCESVGSHFIGRAINEFDVSGLDNVLDVVITNIDVFCASVVRSGFCEGNGGLAVTVEDCGLGKRSIDRSIDFVDETVQPHRFFCHVGRSHIFSFCH